MARRPKTEAKWAGRVAAWRESGKSAAEFASGREYAPSTLKWWSHRLNAEAKTFASETPRVAEPAPPPVELVRVARVPKEGASVERLVATSVVELETIRVRVDTGVDEAALRSVIAALRGAR